MNTFAYVLIALGCILLFIPILALPLLVLYFVIKKAVKNAILEANMESKN